MDAPKMTKSWSFKQPLIKINSIPLSKLDEDETTIEESTPLTMVPPPGGFSSSAAAAAGMHMLDSKASSVTAVEVLPPLVHTHGWKPETMRSPVLLSLTLASLLIAALLEVLAQKSAAEGALSVVKTAEEIPGLVSFAYLYLPTIVAVCYSLVWNWVDLDVKRMQPWLELSKQEGATGNESLFLDYPVDFVAFVPFKAAKRRHWEVFVSGTIVVFVFWILTPMQGAVFGTSSILAQHHVTLAHPQALVDVEQQAALLDQEVLNGGYAVTWLRQAYPAFTTESYALRPFVPSAFGDGAANWTGETTKYWTELKCWPAKATHVPKMPPSVFDFDNGRGCNASALEIHSGRPDPVNPWKMTYIGYQDSAYADYALDCPTCGPAARGQFLATWASYDNSSDTVNVVASFCEPQYYRQRVAATMRASDRAPVPGSIRSLAEPEQLPETEFNQSAFHFLLGAGVSAVDIPRDFPFTSLLSHYYRVAAAGLQYPLTPITALAVGGQKNIMAGEYSDRDKVHRAYEAVHMMLFSLAFQRLLRNSTAEESSSGGGNGTVFVVRYGVTISRTFSALVEGVLLLVSFMTMVLLWSCRRRTSLLPGDPSALGSLVRLVQDAPEVQDLFSGTGHMTEQQLKAKLGEYKFKLVCGCIRDSDSSTLTLVGKPDFDKGYGDVKLQDLNPAGYLKPIKPFVLRKVAGILFALVLCGALAALVYLKKQEAALGGLIRPSQNVEVNQILTNYIPTAFSTLVEPLLVLLNRYLCILQPFYDLTAARRSARTTMDTRYTALPPQLTFVRAVRSRHFLLAAVCATALSANVLSVGLGALFNDLPRAVHSVQPFVPQRIPRITAADLARFAVDTGISKPMTYSDPFYVLMANLTYGTPLPPWSTAEYSFLPLNFTGGLDGDDSSSVFTAVTTGVGVDANCRAVGVFPSVDQPANISSSLLLPTTAFARSNKTGDGPCGKLYAPEPKGFNNTASRLLPTDLPVAAETLDTMTFSFDVASGSCDSTLILGWSRSSALPSANATRRSQTTYMACTPTLRMADFNVTFDRAGRVLTARPVSSFTSTWPYVDEDTSASARYKGLQPVINSIHYSIRNRGDPWHETPLSFDWINYLLVLHRKSRDTLDPAASLPDAAALVPAIEAVYKMVFSSFLTLNMYLFEENNAGDNVRIDGTRTREETRIFMSGPAFIVSTAIIGLYGIIVIAYYGWGVKFFLPRMPSTIGSLLAYVAPSAIVSEPSSEVYSVARRRYERRALIFGRFVGQDGRGQLGISYADKTLPLDLRNMPDGDTRPGLFRRRGTTKALKVRF